MTNLCKQAKELMEKFVSFQINYIPRVCGYRLNPLITLYVAVNLKKTETSV